MMKIFKFKVLKIITNKHKKSKWITKMVKKF